MVRGDSDCQRFCRSCQNDCACLSCNQCHNCRDTNYFNGGYINGAHYHSGCNRYNHSCDPKPKEVYPDAFVSRLKDFPELFGSEIVEIQIGSGANVKIRYVPREALRKHSEYFNRSFAFQEKSGNARAAPIVLDADTDRPEAFDRFIQYIYGKDYIISTPEEESDLDLRLHADVYVLAERLQAPALKELAVKKATAIAVKFSQRMNNAATVAEATLNLECIPGTIEVVYLNTYSSPDVSSDGEKPELKRDKFRSLIAVFSAAFLGHLKKTTGFMECVRGFPDFAVDIIERVPNGTALQVDSDGYVKL